MNVVLRGLAIHVNYFTFHQHHLREQENTLTPGWLCQMVTVLAEWSGCLSDSHCHKHLLTLRRCRAPRLPDSELDKDWCVCVCMSIINSLSPPAQIDGHWSYSLLKHSPYKINRLHVTKTWIKDDTNIRFPVKNLRHDFTQWAVSKRHDCLSSSLLISLFLSFSLSLSLSLSFSLSLSVTLKPSFCLFISIQFYLCLLYEIFVRFL